MIKINSRRSFICGIKSYNLKKEEIYFLKKYKPWGVILFSRNIKNFKQLEKLIKKIKKIFSDDYYPILIDEEGGKVSRLRNFIDNSIFTSNYFGKMYIKNQKKYYLYYSVYIKQITYLLKILGININTLPVLDINRRLTNEIIGDRSFSSNKKVISKIGNDCIKLLHKNRIAGVIKHIPGHGLAKVDSHKKLPIVNHNFSYLLNNDFSVFKNKKSIFAMTAHILFKKIDPNNCVTHSKKIISIIRNQLKYKNLIITDDISMKALKYSISINTRKAFEAGCDLVLHCNGNINEMRKVAINSSIINKFIVKKTYQFRNIIR